MFEIYDTLTGRTVGKARTQLRAIALCDDMQETASWAGRKVKLDVRMGQ